MFQDFFIPFISIGLAELGDKTQLAILCLTTKTKKYISLLLGAILAFFLADGLAVLFGNLLSNWIPTKVIKIIASIVFIIVGVIILLNKEEEDKTCDLKNPFTSSFTLVFLSELGDKTQIASSVFGTEYNPWLAFLGIITALSILSFVAVYIGERLMQKINKKILTKIAGAIFIILGIVGFFK